MPNFLIIGAAKSGTTAFFSYLRQHPDVFMPDIKEPNFFAFEGRRPAFRGPGVSVNASITDRVAYERLFAAAGSATAAGEASNLYLYVPGAADRIHQALPDARLVAILRQPADRAYSGYLHLKRDGREPERSFEAALACEEERVAAGWGFLWRYRDLGYYARQLRPYLELFGREQVLVHLYDDFASDPHNVMRQTYRFLGIDPDFRPNVSARPNQGGLPRAGWRGNLLSRQSKIRHLGARLLPARLRARVRTSVDRHALVPGSFDPAARARLTAEYRDDILQLAALIGRDLSPWLDPGAGR